MFDPFHDFHRVGYLRNRHGLKDVKKVKELEAQSFHINLKSTLHWLSGQEEPGYDDLLETHRRLFFSIYPWAGQDRVQTSPNKTVVKGESVFANPHDIRRAFAAGEACKEPGKALGLWAYAHPFLECNGRALFVFMEDRLRRQGLALAWSSIDRDEFLEALNQQIIDPHGLALDDVLGRHTFRSSDLKDGLGLGAVAWSGPGVVRYAKKKEMR